MSIDQANYAPDVSTATELFSRKALQAFQNRQYLSEIGEDRDMFGASLEIPIIEAIEMDNRGFTSSDIPVENPGVRQVFVQADDFAKKSTVGNSYQTLFSYDLLSSYGIAQGLAASRQIDVQKLNVITGNTYSSGNNNQVAKAADSTILTGTGLNIDQLTQAQTLLQENGYDIMSPLYVVGNAGAVNNILKDARFTNWQYNDARPLTEQVYRRFNSFLDMSFRPLGSVGSNTIDVATATGNETKVYVMTGDSLYNGYNRHIRSVIVPEEFNDRMVCLTTLTMGSVVAYPTGIIEITVDQTPQFA
jgi:hypothetical protein